MTILETFVILIHGELNRHFANDGCSMDVRSHRMIMSASLLHMRPLKACLVVTLRVPDFMSKTLWQLSAPSYKVLRD
jgi:hypothetical protein